MTRQRKTLTDEMAIYHRARKNVAEDTHIPQCILRRSTSIGGHSTQPFVFALCYEDEIRWVETM